MIDQERRQPAVCWYHVRHKVAESPKGQMSLLSLLGVAFCIPPRAYIPRVLSALCNPPRAFIPRVLSALHPIR